MKQNYINPNLFKPFKINKEIVEPKLSDDWEFELEDKKVKLYSKKLNVEITGINAFKFLENIKNEQVNIKEGKFLEGSYIIGSDKKLYSETFYKEFIEKYSEIIEGKITETDLELGNKYIFKNNRLGYLIAIDIIDNKPFYIFMSFEDDYKKKDTSEICLIVQKDLKNLGKKTNEKLNNKYYKYALSAYLNYNGGYFKSELKKSKKIHEVYNNCKFIDKDYFEIKNWFRQVCIYESHDEFKKYRTTSVFPEMTLTFAPLSVIPQEYKNFNYNPEDYCDRIEELKEKLKEITGIYATDSCIGKNIMIKNNCIYYDIYEFKKKIFIVKDCKIKKLNVWKIDYSNLNPDCKVLNLS